MARIRVTEIEFKFLMKLLKDHSFENPIDTYTKRGKYIEFAISEDYYCDLSDFLEDQLQIMGFNENYDLTPEGRIIESVIDKLHDEFEK